MNSLVEAKVKDYLIQRLRYNPHACGTVVEHMRSLARVAGYDLDERFRRANLGAGPEARVASGIVDLALGGGGCETPEYTIRMHVDDWIRRNPVKGL
jgi:hypothetical protein